VLVALKCPVKVGRLKDVALNERAPLHQFTVSARQVIKHDRAQSVGRQSLARVGADEASAASYQDRLHIVPSGSVRRARISLAQLSCFRSVS
jgi:hypothetical protein